MMGRTRKRGSILFSEFGVAGTRTSLSAPFTCHSSRVCVPTTSPEAQSRWHSVHVAVALFLWLSTTGWVGSTTNDPYHSRYWWRRESIVLFQVVITTWSIN